MAGDRLKAFAMATATAFVLAGCGGSHGRSNHQTDTRPAAGGTLTYYVRDETLLRTDPQRLYTGRDLANFGRTVYRGWVAFPASEDVGIATTAVPDLATDPGTSTDGAKTWSFTLKDGVTWEDGRPITCEDFKYGASRSFATDVIDGGPRYLLDYLDIPIDPKTDEPIYTGPYHSSAAGKAAFDQAITCDGKTISYHFKRPWPDFPLAVASQHMADPYRADQDHGAESAWEIFSNGPYRLEGQWDEEKGGTLVRNEHYDPATDSTELRKALPDRIVFDKGRTAEQITERLLADKGADQAAVTAERIPPAYFRRITGEVAERSVAVTSPIVDCLAPNFRRLTNQKVRQALASALDGTAWLAAGGGDKAFVEATDLVNPAVPGYQEGLFPGGSGDPEKAMKLLERAGFETPYPITFEYQSGPPRDEQAVAMKKGWEKAGFDVTLDAADPERYFSDIDSPDLGADVVSYAWGADWPSAITVTPTLFDSRINLTEDSNGQDYGGYRSREFERLVDAAQQAADPDTQTALLQQADQVLRDDVAYLPLGVEVYSMLRGSRVTGYATTPASFGYPDLGQIGVR